jgi:mRNA-degrading endonuclease RelE of RelBE toxin-antitoxin system
MDKKAKLIARISSGDRERILATTDQILSGDLHGLDVKKLRGSINIFRVRVGSNRIKYEAAPSGNIITNVTRRTDHTYRK